MYNKQFRDDIIMYGSIMYQYALLDEKIRKAEKGKHIFGYEAQKFGSQEMKSQAEKVLNIIRDYRKKNPKAARLIENSISILERKCAQFLTPELLKTNFNTLQREYNCLKRLGLKIR